MALVDQYVLVNGKEVYQGQVNVSVLPYVHSGFLTAGEGYVSAGEVDSGDILNANGLLIVLPGGTAINTQVNSGGQEFVRPNATIAGTVVNSGGELTISGALVSNTGTIINSGGYLEYQHAATLENYSASGGISLIFDQGAVGSSITIVSAYVSVIDATAMGTTISDGGYLSVYDDGFYGNGVVSNSVVSSGGELIVGSGGLALVTTVLSGGTVVISSLGGLVEPGDIQPTASNLIVSAGGALKVYSGGITISAALFGSGVTTSAFELLSGGTASATTVFDTGRLVVRSAGLAVSTFLSDNYFGTTGNGGLFVSSGGTAIDTEINSDGLEVVSVGGTDSNATVSSGGFLTVSSGGTTTGTEVLGGGLLKVSSGGASVSASLTGSGITEVALELLYSGTASDTTITDTGRLFVYSGGIASNTIVNSTFYGVPNDGGLFVSSGGIAIDASVNSGGVEVVYSSGNDSGASINDGGYQKVLSGATASGVQVNSGAEEYIFSGGTASNTLVADGGVLTVYLLGKTVSASIFDSDAATSALEVLSGGTASATTITDTGQLVVLSGGVANNTIVNSTFDEADNSGGIFVSSGGVASATEINDGGAEFVLSGGVESGATVSDGGSLIVSSSGTATDVTIHSGGLVTVYDSGTLSGTIVDNGTLDFRITSGDTFSATLTGSGSLIVEGGGTLVVSGGDNFTGSTTISGGTLELSSSGAVGTGSIVFGPGGIGENLKIDGNTMPTNVISGFGPGAAIDLANVTFDIHGATILQTSNNFVGINNHLEIFNSSSDLDFTLDPAQEFSGGFILAKDQGTGTKLSASISPVQGGSLITNGRSYSTAVYPYDSVVKINYPDPSGGDSTQGTGLVIGPHSVLTAAHVVYDYSVLDTTYRNLTVTSGDGTVIGTVTPSQIHINPYYNPHTLLVGNAANDADDFAIIDLPNNLPSFGIQSSYSGGTINLTGYPATSINQVNDIGTVSTGPSGTLQEITASSTSGQSGGPLWFYDGQTAQAVGLVSAESYDLGFTPKDTTIISQLENSNIYVSAGQSTSDQSVYAGYTLDILAGGSANRTVINSGGVENVYGTESGAKINDGGYLYVQVGGTVIGGSDNDPGDEIILSGGNVISGLVGGGEQDVYGLATSTMVMSGTDSSGNTFVGYQKVFSGGVASSTIVSDGGELLVSSGGFAAGANVSSGGQGIVYSAGTLEGTTVLQGGGLVLNAGAILSGPIDFIGSGGTLQINDLASVLSGVQQTDFNSEIAGLGAGDRIILEGFGNFATIDNATPTYNSATNITSLALTDTGSSVATLDLVGDDSGDLFSVSADPNIPGAIDIVACYCRGTLIRTGQGDRQVEDLCIGDEVVTASGERRPIKWIGRRTYSGRFALGQRHILPICIKAGAIEDNVPKRDLWISPHHAMYLEGILIEVKELVNGVTIVQAERVEEVQYFHIELETHDVILAEGAQSESFIDDDSRALFHNADEYRALYPDSPAQQPQYFAPRCEDGYEVEAARRRIDMRSGLRPTNDRAALTLRGCVDIATSGLMAGWAQNVEYPEAPVCLDIYVGECFLGRTLANRYRGDLERAGLGSGCHSFEFIPPAMGNFAGKMIEVRRSIDSAFLGRSRYISRSRLLASAGA